MKKIILVLMLGGLISSCNTNRAGKTSLLEAKSKAIQFVSDKIDSAVVSTDKNGVVSIGDQHIRYVIDPNNIFYGEIDEFEGKDILITVDSLHDPYLMPSLHLILKKENKEFVIQTVIRSDIRVLSLNDRIIIGEVPTHEPSSPLYYCSECRDTLEYRIEGNRLVISNQ